MPRALCAFVGVATAMAGAEAGAQCLGARPFASPAPGTTLPTDPTLYLFNPGSAAAPVVEVRTERGLPLRWKLTARPGTRAFSVWRLDIAAPGGTRLELKADWIAAPPVGRTPQGERVPIDEPQPAKGGETEQGRGSGPWNTIHGYYLIAHSREAPKGALTVEYASQVLDRWTCSYTRLWNVRLSNGAAAWEVEAVSRGRTATMVLPPSLQSFFVPDASEPRHSRQVELGFANCLGATWDWTADTAMVSITALHADGSRQPMDATLVLKPPADPPMSHPPMRLHTDCAFENEKRAAPGPDMEIE